MVSFFVCITGIEAKRQMVLPKLSRRSTQCNETKITIFEGIGTLQQRKGGQNMSIEILEFLIITRSDIIAILSMLYCVRWSNFELHNYLRKKYI